MSLPPIDPVAHLLPYATCAFSSDGTLFADMFSAFEASGYPIAAGPIDRIHTVTIPADAEIRLHPTTLRTVRAAMSDATRRAA